MYQRTEKMEYLDEYERLYHLIQEKGDCLSLKQLAVTGRDIMELGIRQGKEVGGILNMLLDLVLEDPEKNERSFLLYKAREYMDEIHWI